MWDRIKFLLLFFLLFWFFVWSEYSDPNPFNTFGDAVARQSRSKWPLFVLAGIELVRQLHYLVAEHWSRYHRFWSEGVFGRFERRSGRLNDWNRYRLARAMKVIAFLAVLSVVLGAHLRRHAGDRAGRAARPGCGSWLPIVLQAAVRSCCS